MTKYAALDWVYVDTNIPAELITKEYILELQANGLWPKSGEKLDLSDEKYTKFNEITARHIKDIEQYKKPGGSAFNTLSTVSEALGSPVTLVAYVGTKTNAQVIRSRVEELPNFKIMPEFAGTAYEDDILTPSANVINFYEGNDGNIYVESEKADAEARGIKLNKQKINFKHPGRGGDFISKEDIRDAIKECDVFFLAGGVIDKYGIDIFEFTLKECLAQGKEICFALPTTIQTTVDNSDLIKEILMKHASITLSNRKELAPLFGLSHNETLAVVAAHLEDMLSGNKNNFHGDKASAFFTDDANPGCLVNHSSQIDDSVMSNERIPIWPLDDKKIVAKNGCGDASYAGYLIGLELGLSHRDAALLAMRFSAANIQVNEARTPNPKEILGEFGYDPAQKPVIAHGKIIKAFQCDKQELALAHAA